MPISQIDPLRTLRVAAFRINLRLMESFVEIIERETETVRGTYGLTLRALTVVDVLLVGSSYALRFEVDRDGVALSYIDAVGDELRSYELFGFFMRERRDQLTFAARRPEPSDEIRAEVAAMVRHLLVAGADILSGQKAWQSQHGFAVPARGLALTELHT